ncbi:2-keto-4-pentenoate hydratase/2-oxohepta-3-ene-1,7-dioic acid hydratase in catechol pathway [Chelatococcus asaccharovorans]|uniref:2-keto-4-pentenoate hydratase/2-oxohepta-3-ene-1,7-dioic acid hydratase in catechol pathway n=1 Tax=Chelatococcus asaccharovorans TaxID=28210 RepID=A0A2V3TXT2_9HYPH|nr:fumarylacetoacetate hydrolase family protein [Chelatococcus asaccharovorans]MBS7705184.1 fumarylacetoacetate hydrolase family protein [Chelatococcus asaccharovorans]PXW53682.1 2-keto-4-pentenoate hydratase/2-oxohepta-3-ene-1,7-dioic acid hydratase in catechol pathway [Chelatococcus asaccharovorans]
MKLVTFEADGVRGFGVVRGEEVADLAAALGCRSLKEALAQGLDVAAWDRAAAAAPRHRLNAIRLLPPIDDPDKILCVGLNYANHAAESGNEQPPFPSIFVRFIDTFVGHERPVIAPANSEQFDFEGELAVVIGRKARQVRADEALSYVAGYTCMAENSVRDFQKHSRQATPGKNFPESGAVGPWIVTADEIADPSNLRLTTRVNGVVKQQESTKALVFSIPALIAYITQFTELRPGDIIATGTPAGVGSSRKPPEFLRPGDLIEIEVDGIGTLRNAVAAGA